MDDEILLRDRKLQSEAILKILLDAEPEGIGSDELRRMVEAVGIGVADLDQSLKPLIKYANIYFNANMGKYHYMWSSAVQYE
jgi:hypothetical protein